MKLIKILRGYGIKWIWQKAITRFFYLKPVVYDMLGYKFDDKVALEIGGQSFTFSNKGIFPIYKKLKRVDICNYGYDKNWNNIKYKECNNKRNYITDTTNLSMIKKNTYDSILSCHVIEHIANPIKALKEWKRVLKPGGYIILIIPFYRGTFDHKRPITQISHMKLDYIEKIKEDDMTHLFEVSSYHCFKRDYGTKNPDDFDKIIVNNKKTRAMHHHTFDLENSLDIIREAGFKICGGEIFYPADIIVVAKKC